MTREEKARSYDKAKERMRAFLKEWENCGAYGEAMEKTRSVFPELKESEDERIRKALIDGVRQIRCKNGITQEQMLTWLEKQKEQKPVDYEAELKKCKDNPLYFYDKYVSIKPKPVEWSEEDEDAINGAIGILLDDNNPTSVFPEHSKLSVGEIVKRLRSLRPRWKPSEEQMEMLKCTIDYYGSHTPKELVSLYEQLKKLM